jgi:fimbrial isopeptide formation D2 family protein/LPXTG-motif cell wall-anchored protein
MENPKKGARLRRLTATVGAAALALAGAVALAGPANADTTGGNVPAGPYNLTITKLENPSTGGTATNGTQQDVSALTPIAGVQYSIVPVNGIDLSTPAGWTTAATLSVNSSGQVVDSSNNVYTTGTATALPVTNASGVTTYSTSTAAVYEVIETAAPAGTEIAQPFLVTLPLPQNNNWLTNVYVYPKNTVQGAPVKAVDDTAAYGVGDSVNWSITSTVPNQTPSNPFTQYSVSDTLDSRLTPPAAADVTVTVKDKNGNPVTLAAGDYIVTVTGQDVVVDFTASGLALLTANPSGVVTIGFATVVNAVGDGTIQNTANQTIQTQNQATNGTPPITTPTNPVQTTWGDVNLHKVDPNNNALQGAEFQVFTSQADAQALTNPVSVGGSTTFTSDASGNVAISGLKSQVNGAGANLTYYIVETKAPAGYVVAPAFAQSTGGYAITVQPGTANATVTVTDPQAPPIALPLTGSTGTTIFITGGLAVAAMAVATALILSRRRRSAVDGLAVVDNASQQ